MPAVRPNRTSYPDGHAELILTPQGAVFRLSLANPAGHEVNAFGKGNAEFAIVPGDHVLMWCYRFTNPRTANPLLKGPGIPWSDAPWSYHAQAQAVPVVIPGMRGTTLPLYLYLVDAATGILKAQRLITPAPEFADALRDASERQASRAPDLTATSREIDTLYARHRTTSSSTRPRGTKPCGTDGTGSPSQKRTRTIRLTNEQRCPSTARRPPSGRPTRSETACRLTGSCGRTVSCAARASGIGACPRGRGAWPTAAATTPSGGPGVRQALLRPHGHLPVPQRPGPPRAEPGDDPGRPARLGSTDDRRAGPPPLPGRPRPRARQR